MNASDLIAKAARLREETAACREYWTTTLPREFLPEDHQFQLWLRMYGGLDNVVAGMERVQQWLIQIEQETPGTVKTKTDIIQYASGVMRNLDRGIDPTDKGKWMGEK